MTDDDEQAERAKRMTYHVSYTIKVEEPPISFETASAAHAIDRSFGACTAVVIGSILYPEDGSYSSKFSSVDGRSKAPLSAGEMFKAWVTWGMSLAEDPELSDDKRKLCKAVIDTILGQRP